MSPQSVCVCVYRGSTRLTAPRTCILEHNREVGAGKKDLVELDDVWVPQQSVGHELTLDVLRDLQWRCVITVHACQTVTYALSWDKLDGNMTVFLHVLAQHHGAERPAVEILDLKRTGWCRRCAMAYIIC